MARRVEQVEDGIAILEEGHHCAGDGDCRAPALIFIQSERARRASTARLHPSRRADGAAKQKKMLRQGRLARVGMRDDGKRPPPLGLASGRVRRGCKGVAHKGAGDTRVAAVCHHAAQPFADRGSRHILPRKPNRLCRRETQPLPDRQACRSHRDKIKPITTCCARSCD